MTRPGLPDAPGARAPEARLLIDELVAAGGGAVRAIVLYGSQLVRASPGAASAWDFVVIVDAYGPFHRALCGAGRHRRPAWLLTLLGHLLPPNITAFSSERPDAPLAKCVVVSARHFARALAPRAPDHFLKGRMVQQVAVAWARSPEDGEWVRDRLADARDDVVAWAGPFMDHSFTAEGFARRMLHVSYGAELRPEGGSRVDEVFEAQRAFLAPAYRDVLERASAAGTVEPNADGRWHFSRSPGPLARLRVRAYFTRSKVRSTLRWGKHILTFNDWLGYVQKKVERRTGLRVEVTEWERRLPLLLLWPKVFHVLRHRDRGTPPADARDDLPQSPPPAHGPDAP